jgi:formiminotetrahydrofolate cyclodeaminase
MTLFSITIHIHTTGLGREKGSFLMKEPFLDDLSNPEPNPGGGAAAAYSACLGLALLKKVIQLELNRPNLSPELTAVWNDLLEHVDVVGVILRQLLHDDGRAYLDFAEARADGEEGVIANALGRVINVPILIMEESCQGLGLISEAGKHCKRHLLSDLLVAGEFFLAAVQGAYHIARANLCLIPNDPSTGRPQGKFRDKIKRQQNCCQDAYDMVQEELRLRIRSGGKVPG